MIISKKSVTRGLLALSAAALLATACDSGGATTTTGTAPGGGAIDSAKALGDAKKATEAAFEGTERPVDTTSRAGVKGKKLAIVVSGMAATSSKVPAQGAEEAAKALGWDVTIYDATLNPARYPELVRQAVAAGADGIVLVAIDCEDAKQPLEEAKEKGIAVTSVYAFDCDDELAGSRSNALFTQSTNFGPKATTIQAFTQSYGADQANYVIANSNNQAKIIEITAPEFTVLNHTAAGFERTIQQSGGSEIVATVPVTQADLIGSQVTPKVQAELLKHPEATWIKSPFSYVTTLGVAPALGSSAGKVKVMGGEGFAEETDLIHDGKVTAVNVISSTWNGWAAVDVLNSVWRKEKSADSGIGWTMVDADHDLPAEGKAYQTPVDFRSAYRKAWGIG
jgi:ribose transport system substrate-binding protein